MDEMTRQRRAERAELTRVKWGCVAVLALMVVAMVVLFVFG
jgi:hypothetical protein